MKVFELTKEEIAANIKESVDRVGRSKVISASQVTGRTLDNYTSGESEPKVRAAIAIANAVGESVEYMITRAEAPLEHGSKTTVTTQAGGKSALIDRVFTQFYEVLKPELERKIEFGNLSDMGLEACVLDASGHRDYRAGDIVLLDKSDLSPKDGCFYLFSFQSASFVRELRLMPGEGWKLDSAGWNSEDPILDLETASVPIKGRVISHIKLL